MDRDRILSGVAGYYTDRLREFGTTARGADWRDEASQELRFAQLLKLVERPGAFGLNDYGCGYGALALYLRRRGFSCEYHGFDISAEMLQQARELNPEHDFVADDGLLGQADYTLASGIFNVRLEVGDEEWTAYVLDTLDRLDALSCHGFAFNMLTEYSDEDRMQPTLFYGDPGFFFDHCKRRYSRHVSLLHDYGLYEFTLLVRREPTSA
jgi:SAM-dependent methyltransferase